MQRANVAVVAACLGLMSCGESTATRLPNQYGPGGGGVMQGDGDTGGGGGTGGGGTGDGDTGGGGLDDGTCQEQEVANARVIPEMLIVLDRSGSMKGSRWTPSVNAIKSVTAELGDTIEFGLMAFPGASAPVVAPMPKDCSGLSFWEALLCEGENAAASSGWGGGGDTCQAGTVAVPVGLGQAAEIADALSGMAPSGDTPTAVSVAEAGRVLKDEVVLDGKPQPKYVLLVTDGEPRCNKGVNETVKEIEKLAAQDIKTFVIGYEISGGTIQDMDRMAQAGGTGATKHIAVQNEATLVTALTEITGQIASCTIVLEKPVSNPEYVLVTVDGHGITLDQPDGNGFSVSSDGSTVTIQGTTCDLLRQPELHKVNVQVLCDIPIIQ